LSYWFTEAKARTQGCFASLNMTKALKRIGHAHLWSEQIQTRIWIALSAIGEMLVKHACVQFPVIVQLVGNAGGRYNVEGEILYLSAGNFRLTIDPHQPQPA